MQTYLFLPCVRTFRTFKDGKAIDSLKTPPKQQNGKTKKYAEKQDNESTRTGFKITIRGDCKCFCMKAGTCIHKKKPSFNLMYEKF